MHAPAGPMPAARRPFGIKATDMPQKTEWAFPPQLQPKPEDFQFNLDQALNSLVLLRAEIPEDAFTAPNLGT